MFSEVNFPLQLHVCVLYILCSGGSRRHSKEEDGGSSGDSDLEDGAQRPGRAQLAQTLPLPRTPAAAAPLQASAATAFSVASTTSAAADNQPAAAPHPTAQSAPALVPTPEQEAPVDLVRLLDQSADAVHSLWQDILRTYKLPRSHTTDAYSDSKILLRCIATAWIRLGQEMLRKTQDPNTPKGKLSYSCWSERFSEIAYESIYSREKLTYKGTLYCRSSLYVIYAVLCYSMDVVVTAR